MRCRADPFAPGTIPLRLLLLLLLLLNHQEIAHERLGRGRGAHAVALVRASHRHGPVARADALAVAGAHDHVGDAQGLLVGAAGLEEVETAGGAAREPVGAHGELRERASELKNRGGGVPAKAKATTTGGGRTGEVSMESVSRVGCAHR